MTPQEPRARGIVVRDAHFPGRVPIDAYGNGGFRFAEMSHRGSILCVPSGIYGWDPVRPEDLDRDSFERILAEAAGIELLLRVPARRWFRSARPSPTRSAKPPSASR